MNRLVRLCVHRPIWIVGLVIALTLAFGSQIPRIKIDPRVEIVLRQNNPVEKEYAANKERFASYADILVGMMHEDIYNPASMGKIQAIMEETEGIRGVKKVTSILNVKNIQGVDGGLEVKPMAAGGTVPRTPGEFDGLRERAMSWNVYDGTYVTRDGKGTALAIVLQDDIETDDIVPIYYRLENIVQKHQGPEEFFISGPTVVEALQGHYMIKDLELLVPLVLVVLLASLFVFFRSIQGMLLPLLGVALSCSWTMGLMALLGIPLTMVTTALPVALMAVSSAYGIHVLENVFSDAHDGSGGKAGIIRALERVRLPVIMAGLTTIASFLSLCTTPIVPITQFGVLCAFGIGSTLILSLTFIPAVLSILDSAGRVHVSHHHTRRDLVGPMLRWLERVTITKSWFILAWSGILLVISVFGAFYVKSDLNLIEDFRKDSPIRIADEILNRNFAGTSLFNVAFTGDGEDAMKDPAVLRDMERLQTRLGAIGSVGKAVSIVDFIKRMNQAMHDGDPAHYVIPDSRELIAQYLLLFSFSGGGDELDSFVNYDFSQGQILLQMKSQSGYLAQEVVDTVEEFERNDLRGAGITGLVTTGLAMLAKEFNRLVVWSQVTSFVVAFVLVMLVTAATFRSFKLGVYSMIPLVVPIIFNFGVMGATGIKLNAATAIIASLAIGMGIDYSIHFLSRYRHEIVLVDDVDRAIRIALHTSGRAIVYNALAVAAGFLVFVPSNFVILSQMGMLVALVMMTTSTAAITLLPALVKVFPPRLVKESLPRPATEVQLRLVTSGASPQARQVACEEDGSDTEKHYREVQQ